MHGNKHSLPLATGGAEGAVHPGISGLLTLNSWAKQEVEIVLVFLNPCSMKGLGKLKYCTKYNSRRLFLQNHIKLIQKYSQKGNEWLHFATYLTAAKKMKEGKYQIISAEVYQVILLM